MNNQYLSLTKQVLSKVSPAASWKSDQKSLIGIFEYADCKNIDPIEVLGTDMCKLRTIIKAAKAAIANDDPERLQYLFHLAAASTIVELRLGLGITQPEIILGYKLFYDTQGEIDYLALSPVQLERLERAIRLIFKIDWLECGENGNIPEELLPEATTLDTTLATDKVII